MSAEDEGRGGGVLEVPDPRGPVIAAGDQPAVGCEGQGGDRSLVAAEDEGRGGGVLEVPDPRGLVLACR